MSKSLSLPKFKQFIRSLNLSQDELVRRWKAMNNMVIREIETTNDPKVIKFLTDRKQFLADEAMKIVLRKEIA